MIAFVLLLAMQQPTKSAFADSKAVALMREQLPCLGCHELNGEGGRSAPPLTTVGQRRSSVYIAAMILDPQVVVPGSGMPKTAMPASTRESIVRYLSRNATPGAPPGSRAPAAPRGTAPVAVTYARWCAACHGEKGGGDGPNARYLTVKPAVHRDAARMSALTDDALYDAIAGGGLVMGRSARMPGFGETLTHTEIRALVAYIRGLCACTGPAWSRDGSRQ